MIDYTGYLLAAHPLMQKIHFQHGVIFVADNCKTHGTFGFQINHQIETTFNLVNVMDQLGFSTTHIDSNIPIYRGGIQHQNRIYVLHSSDWQGKTTVFFNDEIGLTSDVSILDALSKLEGPEYFKIIAGSYYWPTDSLENQIMNLDQGNNYETWTYALPTKELVFDLTGKDQWYRVLEKSSVLQIERWFG